MKKLITVILSIIVLAGGGVVLNNQQQDISFGDKINYIEEFASNKQAYGWEIDLNIICCHDYAWVAKLNIINPIFDEENQDFKDENNDEEYLSWGLTYEEAIDNLILKIDNNLTNGDKK